jgi:hypothetical protein
MTIDDPRTTLPTQAVPRPRAPQDDAVEAQEPASEGCAPGAPVGEFPWPEPWHHSRGARPRSEYWDAASARWHSRGPVVSPRRPD